MTTDLSRIPGMFVISRNTAFTYKDKRVDTKQIGRELGVRYVLEGSVRRSGNRLRVSSPLIDATTDAHLWADRFDCDTGDLFALQNEITNRLARTLSLELVRAEAARPTQHPDALDYILRGRAALLKPDSRDSYAEAIGLFEHALSLDPQSVEAQIGLAGSLASPVMIGFSGFADSRAADLARADELIGRALAVSPGYALAHHVKGQALRAFSSQTIASPMCDCSRCTNPMASYHVSIRGSRGLRRKACSVSVIASSIDPAKSLHQARPLNAPTRLGSDASAISYSGIASSHRFCARST